MVKQTCMEAPAFDTRFGGLLESYAEEDSHRHGVDIALETDHYKQHVVVVGSIVAVAQIDVYAVRDGDR